MCSGMVRVQRVEPPGGPNSARSVLECSANPHELLQQNLVIWTDEQAAVQRVSRQREVAEPLSHFRKSAVQHHVARIDFGSFDVALQCPMKIFVPSRRLLCGMPRDPVAELGTLVFQEPRQIPKHHKLQLLQTRREQRLRGTQIRILQ